MPVIELRGPCNHLTATLDTDLRLIEKKCSQCSQDAGKPVFHYFDAETGQAMEDGKVDASLPDVEPDG